MPALTKAKDKDLTKRPRPHDLRHTNAGWLIQAGVPLTVIQRHLGHESIHHLRPLRASGPSVVTGGGRLVGNALKPRKAASTQRSAASL